MSTFVYGFGLSMSLIVAIGSQNSYVLKQGLKGEHVFWVCLLCSFSDAALIFVGVSGFHLVITQFPGLTQTARYGGALFLFIYGAMSFWSAMANRHTLKPGDNTKAPLYRVLLTTLAFTWLNPHVYLDTLLLLGSVSTQYAGETHMFAAGAMLASFVFFFSLGYGAALLRPVFANPVSWRVLEGLIGIIMWSIGWSLL